MTRPSLTTIARQYLDRRAPAPLPSTVLVALSGGPDSMALVDVLASLGPKRRPALRIVAHGVDHGLRPEAAAELDLAAAFCDRIGVPFTRTVVHVAAGGNLQARAREARWQVLADAARRSAAAIATGHHADDRAETFLLRLLRGAGARGLGVLPAHAPAPDAPDILVLRPLLEARRADVEAHVARRSLPHVRDPSNEDRRHLRTRVRLDVLPLLAALDPAIVTHLGTLADELGHERPPTREAAEGGEGGGEGSLRWTALLPRATQTALASLVASRSAHTRVWLPGGIVAIAGTSVQREPKKRQPRPTASRKGSAVR